MMSVAVRQKPFSTKAWGRLRPPPDVAREFEQLFVTGGWPKVNHVYGKRCANRWYIMLGPERLKAARERFKRGQS